MLTKTVVICLLIGASFARKEDQDNKELLDTSETNNAKREAAISSSYGPPSSSSSDKEPAPVYGAPSSPTSYSKSIPAAAIRNVETVAVTKTITPVVTKTTTYNTHSEPALSIGHVQGYSHSATGEPKIAPVQFQTQYTSYHNPTVGVNGPVTYTGPAVVLGGGYAIPLTGLSQYATAAGGQTAFTLASVSGGSGRGASTKDGSGSSSSSYGPPSESSGAPASTYGPPGQSAGSPLGSYSAAAPQYVSVRPSNPTSIQHAISLQNLHQMQRLRAPAPYPQQSAASAISPVSLRPQVASSPYVMYQGRPVSLSSFSPMQFQPASAPSNLIPAGLKISPQQLQAFQALYAQQQPQYLQQQQPQYLQQQQPQYLQQQQPQYLQQQQPQYQQQLQYQHQPISHQPVAQPSVRQYVQTYAMPSISFTRLQAINKHLQSQQQPQLVRAIRH